MKMRCQGFTLVEMLVYICLSVMVLGVIYSVFVSGRRHYEAASSSYLVSREAETALRWLRSDLQQASLASLRVYPNKQRPNAAPCISMASPRNLENSVQLTHLGAPNWSSFVYYSLERDGKLVRRMEDHDFQGRPTASVKEPGSVVTGNKQRVILHGVSQPLTELQGLGKLSQRGGFDLQFIRRLDNGEEFLTEWNPSQVSNGEVALEGANTKLLQLLITVEMANFRRSKKSYVQLPIRVMPRH